MKVCIEHVILTFMQDVILAFIENVILVFPKDMMVALTENVILSSSQP